VWIARPNGSMQGWLKPGPQVVSSEFILDANVGARQSINRRGLVQLFNQSINQSKNTARIRSNERSNTHSR
jgi:hypothetical protein